MELTLTTVRGQGQPARSYTSQIQSLARMEDQPSFPTEDEITNTTDWRFDLA